MYAYTNFVILSFRWFVLMIKMISRYVYEHLMSYIGLVFCTLVLPLDS